ncbi:iron-sulfur cluster assembly protein [Streptomyces sp. A7024]|uniref:Iron-sulfur cluster assembly protein n=1 Tax=Streptomyces coryli TaxID=1128680 RepID=A0A6G4UDW5_9ACTN|nr:iron-sulfur cluster assembly protein [Streptomyces coryli]NGN69900.1 iron-sulfur cluster assembly protein [Streptomyces coryli]
MSGGHGGTGEILTALGTVHDPELDEPITDLGFVTEAARTGAHVQVKLRLPTYFCAPNFAYLMVADAHDAVRKVPGVASVEIRLEDHFAAEEINAGVAAQSGFAGTFPGLATEELAHLRETFRRKAYLAALERLCRTLPPTADLPALTLADLPPSAQLTALLDRRRALGLPTAPGAPLLLDEQGAPLPPDRLRFAQAVRVSIEGNAGWCRGLLATRYGPAQPAATSP